MYLDIEFFIGSERLAPTRLPKLTPNRAYIDKNIEQQGAQRVQRRQSKRLPHGW
jgi:hypothetical protein